MRGCSQRLDLRVLVASDDRSHRNEVLDGVAVTRTATYATLAATPICLGMTGEIRRSSADIVHIHLPNPMAVMAYLASGSRARLVVTYHSDTVRQKVLGALFDPFLHQCLRRSTAIIATSPDYRASSPALTRYQDRCHVIPLGIALEQFERPDPEETSKLRRQLGERLVISVGRLVYYKGFEYLIRAMSEVRGRLVIIGDGPLRSKLAELAHSLGLEDKVVLLGEIPGEIVSYYHSADVFALSSIARSEAFGIVQVEAMAAGLPVVNTRLDSGVPFVSVHEQTGLTVPPGDPGALANALNRLLDDASLRRALGSAAHSRARQEFSVEIMIQRTFQLYDRIMNEQFSPSSPRLSA